MRHRETVYNSNYCVSLVKIGMDSWLDEIDALSFMAGFPPSKYSVTCYIHRSCLVLCIHQSMAS